MADASELLVLDASIVRTVAAVELPRRVPACIHGRWIPDTEEPPWPTPRPWPTWRHSITEARLGGPISPGPTFHWTAAGLTVDSTVHAVNAPYRILWGSPAHGVTGAHGWTFTEDGDGTVVHTGPALALPRGVTASPAPHRPARMLSPCRRSPRPAA